MTDGKIDPNINGDQEEFAHAIRDITREALHLESIHDRVRCIAWIEKLIDIPDRENGLTKLKNDYIQYLRLMVKGRQLHGPFIHMPPDNDLVPLPEKLGNEMSETIPELPRMGPIAPIITHQSKDGRAHLSAQRIPGGGIFCYLAVSPDAFTEFQIKGNEVP
ncbi:uncharacterized protein [Hetaerina americana]|uniref:uncharacterized protein n=1 Tax=Hetaerina americana TaxID=62018 RepID=UPI003A7F3A3A